MSEQSDALNKLAREKGILRDSSPPDGSTGGRPQTDLPWVALPRFGEQMLPFASEVSRILGANGMYRRGAIPVTIDPETGAIEDMDAQRFRTYAERELVAYVTRNTAHGTLRQPATMTVDEARGCMNSDAFRYPLRKLHRVNSVRLPVMRADGRIELLPRGYDRASQIFTMKDGLEYDLTWDMERARRFLDDLLGEFPFSDERSRAAHITAMVAMFGASLQPIEAKRLNFVYRANQPRAGKGLLAATAIVGPCGPLCIQAIPDSREEFKKILDTEALNGSPYIFFDKVAKRLDNRTLNAFLTASVWTGRLFNSQKKFQVAQTSTVFLTGNNIELSLDLAGRCLLIDLWAGEADMQSRQIKHVIDEGYLARPAVRADILSALWALVRGWNEARPLSRPPASDVFRGFESFSNIFGGIVEHAGYGHPLQSAAAEVDPDFADMRGIDRKAFGGCEHVGRVQVRRDH